ncbi:TetR/AcrR family transcriptional regulator [Paenibacillus sp. DMB5]|uniref:TetR/AcrR family transcriptional regulator n=1 Tax=Paenibacillus sp. DMB5 TaxID=1780103 RepID=UPI00076CBE61|nr:TetR/AcrR family transcriptional regulator [Paenibacillus sp. DMB5]KUP25814.1 hypothetical protein AWJ19_19515 [Paenibacillus sp. DMB5]
MSANSVKEAAFKLFALKGYEATTMRDIANEVGIKPASIYHHYESKEAIFLLLVNEMLARISWELNEEKLEKEIDLKQTLYDAFISYYDFFSTHDLELKFWQRIRFFAPLGMESAYSTNILGSGRTLLELYIELFNRAMRQKKLEHPIEMYVMSYFSFLSGYLDSLLIVPFKLSTIQLNQAFEIYWNGFELD